MYCLLMASVNIEAGKVLEMLTVEPFYSSYVKDGPMIKKLGEQLNNNLQLDCQVQISKKII